VRTFDYGPEPVVSAYDDTARLISLLPNNVIETFIGAKAPQNTNDRVPLELVVLNASIPAYQISSEFAGALRWFSADTRSLLVENQFDYIGEANLKERHQAHWKFLNSQVEKLGGVDRAFFSALPPEFKLDLKDEPTNSLAVPRLNANELSARLGKLLESTNYAVFVGLDDKKYSFTKEERELILKRGKKYFEEIQKELVKQLCHRLEEAPRDLGLEANGSVGEDDIVANLEQRVIEVAKYVVLAKDETNRIAGRVDKGYVEVPVFKYDQETRIAAAKMLNEHTGSFKGWADDAKGELNGKLKQEVEDDLNLSHFKDFKVSMLSRPLRDWYQQQQDVLGMLPPSAGENSPPLPSK
jgi:hypothetical protein